MIKVVEWGTGKMGQGLLGYILDRPKDIELVGFIVTNPAKEGKTVGELLGRPCDVKMTTDFEEVLAKKPDVVCINTQTNLDEVEPQIVPALKAGADVICIAEKLAYPWASDPARADLFDRVAKENGVTILGTGINPGFMLDALIVMWSSICMRVDSIEASRVNDLSPFGPTVMTGQGVGTTVEQFEKGVADGSIVGHIGFPESHQAHRQGAGLEDRRDRRDARAHRHQGRALHAARQVPAGWVAGCKQVGKGYINGELKIHLIHPQQIHPEMADQGTGDYIKIIGDPMVNMANTPRDPGRQGHLRQHRQLHPAHEGRPGRHADRRRHAAAALPERPPSPRRPASERERSDRMTETQHAREGDWVEVECVLLEPADSSRTCRRRRRRSPS